MTSPTKQFLAAGEGARSQCRLGLDCPRSVRGRTGKVQFCCDTKLAKGGWCVEWWEAISSEKPNDPRLWCLWDALLASRNSSMLHATSQESQTWIIHQMLDLIMSAVLKQRRHCWKALVGQDTRWPEWVCSLDQAKCFQILLLHSSNSRANQGIKGWTLTTIHCSTTPLC